MTCLSGAIQSADWKKEKHVPVIECADTVAAGESFTVTASLGKEIAHPNTIEHHISWIQLFFKPDDEKFAYEIGRFEFSAHGEGAVYTDYAVTVSVKVGKSGTLQALSLCNIHGLWESCKAVKVG